VPILAGLLNFVPSLVLFFGTDPQIVMGATLFTSGLTAFFLGPCIAVTHSLVNARMRSFASAIFFFILNLIGLGLGPLAVGIISDVLTPEFGDLSLRWAFVATFIPGVISLILFILAAKNYPADYEAASV
jgi:MFS family permease